MSWITSPMNRQVLADLTEFNKVESDHIEPGLLPAFRLFVGFQLIILCFALAVVAVIRPKINIGWLGLTSLLWMTTFLAYLFWPAARRKLGKYYLPIALFVASVLPIALRINFYYLETQQDLPFTAVAIASSGWRLFVVLIVPLVFIAWQYNFRTVLIFSGGTLLLNLALVFWLPDPNRTEWMEVIDLSLSSAISFTLIGYIVTRLVDAQREKQQVLEEANTKLIDHAATVEQLAISHERNRLARDLHDTLAHTLSAVAIQLEAADSAWEHSPDHAHELLHKSLVNARNGLAETRRALRALRAAPLDDLGLPLALRTLAESTAARNGLALELNVPDTLTLAPELEENIYRIAQEALTNTVRHADAHTLWVLLYESSDDVALEIRDDGTGSDVDEWERSDHYGMRGMKERAEAIGADITVNSHPQRGTTVRLVVHRKTGVKK